MSVEEILNGDSFFTLNRGIIYLKYFYFSEESKTGKKIKNNENTTKAIFNYK